MSLMHVCRCRSHMETLVGQRLTSRSSLTSTRCRKTSILQVSLFRRMFSSDVGFSDRFHAGEQLGAALYDKLREEKPEDMVVLGLVRGGMPVAEPVANALNAPLDAFISRKIGAPYQPEFGIGAIAEGGHTILNEHAVRLVGATPDQLNSIRQQEDQELQRRKSVYRGGKECLPVTGKIVVVVDDGLATGVTARAALTALKAQGAARLILAVPVGSAGSVADIKAEGVADEVVCLMTPRHFRAVGQWYEDFSQTTDAEVVKILHRFEQRNSAARAAAAVSAAKDAGNSSLLDMSPAGADATPARQEAATAPAAGSADGASSPAAAASAAASRGGGMSPVTDEEVVLHSRDHQGIHLHGTLNVPPGARGLVVFAHGSGSSRNSPRNRQVAATLNSAGFATLLFDLLSVPEAQDRRNVFDISLLASRLQLAVEWLEVSHKLPSDFPLGFFGASTGGGAALWAAAYLDKRVSAVVVRGGRPDLAAEKLPAVSSPTLLLVGGEDTHVLGLNKAALRLLGSGHNSKLVIVPHAGHLFEGPGQLEVVADQAAGWFAAHLGPNL